MASSSLEKSRMGLFFWLNMAKFGLKEGASKITLMILNSASSSAKIALVSAASGSTFEIADLEF